MPKTLNIYITKQMLNYLPVPCARITYHSKDKTTDNRAVHLLMIRIPTSVALSRLTSHKSCRIVHSHSLFIGTGSCGDLIIQISYLENHFKDKVKFPTLGASLLLKTEENPPTFPTCM